MNPQQESGWRDACAEAMRSGEAGVPGPEASSFQILDVGVECPLLFVSSYLFLLKKDREAWLAAVHGSQRIGHN